MPDDAEVDVEAERKETNTDEVLERSSGSWWAWCRSRPASARSPTRGTSDDGDPPDLGGLDGADDGKDSGKKESVGKGKDSD